MEKKPAIVRPEMPRQTPTKAGKFGIASNLYCHGGPPVPRCCAPAVPAPSPLLRYMADHSSRVVAGENVDVTEVRTPAASTYIVSSKTSPETERKLKELEDSVAAQLAEIARIKASMLTVDEDPTEEGNGIVFSQGME